MKKKKGLIVGNQTLLILDLLSFYVSIFISDALCENAFFGAAVFIAGSSARSFFGLYEHRKELRNHRMILYALLIAASIILVSSATTLSFSAANQAEKIAVGGMTLLLVLRSAFTYEIVYRFHENIKKCMVVMALAQAVLTAALVVVLLRFSPWRLALPVGVFACLQPAVVLVWLFRSRHRKIVQELHMGEIEAASFKLYSSLRLCSEITFYLSLMAYTGMLEIMPIRSGMLLPVVLLIALLLVGTVLTGRAFRAGKMNNVEKNSLFLIGGFIWLFARVQLNESFAQMSSALFWVWIIVQALGLSIMLLLASQMQKDMKLVLELSDEGDESSLDSHHFLYQHFAFLIAGMLISVELYLLNLFVEKRIEAGVSVPEQSTLVWILSALPMVFVLLSMFFAIVQPLNRDIVRKLRLYHEQKLSKTIIPELENKLKRLLVKRYRKRIGAKILAFALKPFFPHRIIGAKNVALGDGPVIFVANHREIYGPLMLNLYLPFTFRPWIESRMIEPSKIQDYLWETIFSKMKPAFWVKPAHRIVCSFSVWLLNSVEPIPVYRGTMREVVVTMEMSVTALQEQDNLLIFPENSEKSGGKYAQQGISPFFTGFVSVAKYYYRKTKKPVTFYPVYAEPKKRTLTIGGGVAYDPDGDCENERISEQLMRSMNEMAVK